MSEQVTGRPKCKHGIEVYLRCVDCEELDALTAKLQAAEVIINECLNVFREKVHFETTNLVPAIHHIIEERAYWRDRTRAAEAEVGRLKNDSNGWRNGYVHCRERIAELEQSIGLLTTLAPTMEMDSSNPMSMARTIEAVVLTRIAELEAEVARLLDLTLQPRNLREQSLMIENGNIRRTATEAALEWAYTHFTLCEHRRNFINRGLAALLGVKP